MNTGYNFKKLSKYFKMYLCVAIFFFKFLVMHYHCIHCHRKFGISKHNGNRKFKRNCFDQLTISNTTILESWIIKLQLFSNQQLLHVVINIFLIIKHPTSGTEPEIKLFATFPNVLKCLVFAVLNSMLEIHTKVLLSLNNFQKLYMI